MYIQCPECLTIYEMDEDALQASLGIVRCGRCAKRFDALRALSHSLPFAPLAKSDPAARAPTLTEAVQAGMPGPEASMPAVGAIEEADNGDDWFAAIESELNAATAMPEPPSADDPGETKVWSVELPGAADVTVAEPAESAEAQDGHGDDSTGMEADAIPEIAEPAPDDTPAATDIESPPDVADAEATADAIDADTADGIDSATAESTPDAATEIPTAEPEVPVATETAPDDGTEPAIEPVPAHVYVRPRGRRIPRASVAWAGGCGVLALALATQLVWAHRVDLFRDPSTRPWMARVCASIPCGLPPIKDLSRLELLSRDVRPDPGVAGALMITATVRNNATFRQPWPVVVVELTDLDNRPVAMRRFRPAEYMPDAAREASGIAPGATAVLAFEVADPGKSAVAFQFGFQ